MSHFFNTLCLQYKKKNTLLQTDRLRAQEEEANLNDMGWKGVRDPLYIYGLCRTGGSGAVKWSHAPKSALNSKSRADGAARGNGKQRDTVTQAHDESSSKTLVFDILDILWNCTVFNCMLEISI